MSMTKARSWSWVEARHIKRAGSTHEAHTHTRIHRHTWETHTHTHTYKLWHETHTQKKAIKNVESNLKRWLTVTVTMSEESEEAGGRGTERGVEWALPLCDGVQHVNFAVCVAKVLKDVTWNAYQATQAGNKRTFNTTYGRVCVCVCVHAPPTWWGKTLNRTPMKLVFPQIKPGVN